MNLKITYYHLLTKVEVIHKTIYLEMTFGPYSYPNLLIGSRWQFEGDNMFNRAKYEFQDRSWKTISTSDSVQIRCIINYLEAVWEEYRKDTPSWKTN
jgi:hypothetical protein